MEAVFKFLSENPLLTIILIAILVIVVFTLVGAAIQGRKVKFYPPEIGPKEGDNKSKTKGVSTKPSNKSISEEELEDLLFQHSSKRYGVGYKSMLCECEINNDGTATFKRTVELIAESDIGHLDASLNIPTPKDGKWDLDLLQVHSTTPGRVVTVDQEKTESNVQSVQLSFSPTLHPKNEAGYILAEKIREPFYSFVHTRYELKDTRVFDDIAGYNDYFAWHINRPTKHLRLRVTFPEYWKPSRTDSKVFMAKASGFPASNEQREEYRRIKFNLVGPEVGRYYLELEVSYPMIGLIYIASWEPIFSKL